jgi:RHS repeat-associated protein
MQLASSSHIPGGLLAANVLLNEKPRHGVTSTNPAPYPGIDECNSTTAIGLQAGLLLNRVESRYTGKERDTESGNDYFGARYYASSMGRFLSPDPSQLYFADPTNPQSLNLYSYAINNPVKNTDPTGMAYCQWNDNGVISRDDSAHTGVPDAVNSGTECTHLGGEWKHDDGLNDDGSPMGSEEKPAITTTVGLNTRTDQTTVSTSGPYYDPQEVSNYMLLQYIGRDLAWVPTVCNYTFSASLSAGGLSVSANDTEKGDSVSVTGSANLTNRIRANVGVNVVNQAPAASVRIGTPFVGAAINPTSRQVGVYVGTEFGKGKVTIGARLTATVGRISTFSGCQNHK